jgi:hypothetical protein
MYREENRVEIELFSYMNDYVFLTQLRISAIPIPCFSKYNRTQIDKAYPSFFDKHVFSYLLPSISIHEIREYRRYDSLVKNVLYKALSGAV